jgi:hypothetical protein
MIQRSLTSKNNSTSLRSDCSLPMRRSTSLTPNNNQLSSSSSNQKPKNMSSGSNDTLSSLKPAYVNKLGKDGKLSSAECICHITNKLCLFCGQSRHMVDSCPEKAAKKACVALTIHLHCSANWLQCQCPLWWRGHLQTSDPRPTKNQLFAN